MFLIKRRYSVVNNRQYISLDTNIYGGSVGTVKVGVLDQVGNQYRTKRFIHPDREGTGQMQTTTDFMLSVYIVIKRLPLLDQGNEIDVGALRKLTVIYLGKQQQRFIQPDDMVERTPHLNNFARRFLVQVRTIEQILHTSAKYSQRSLQLVRGIAYKLFLTLEQLLGAIHGLLCRNIQSTKFGNRGIVRHRRDFAPGSIAIQPMQQLIKRKHAFMEHPQGRSGNCHQKEKIEPHDPPHDCFQQIVFFESRHSHLQFIKITVLILKNSRQHPGRLGFILFRNIHLGIVVVDRRTGGDVSGFNGDDRVTVVGTFVRTGQRLPGKHPHYDQFRIILESIVRFIVYLVHHGKIKHDRP